MYTTGDPACVACLKKCHGGGGSGPPFLDDEEEDTVEFGEVSLDQKQWEIKFKLQKFEFNFVIEIIIKKSISSQNI